MYLQPLPYNIHFNYHIYYTTITTTTVTIIQNTLQISDTVYYYHTNSTTVQYSTYFRASGLEHLIELLAVSRDLLHLQSIPVVAGVVLGITKVVVLGVAIVLIVVRVVIVVMVVAVALLTVMYIHLYAQYTHT